MKEKINQLKQEKNAVILTHYYAPAEAQEVADYVGDSFYLAKIAKKSTADILVFCGVSFMGESAKILNPDKKVLMPDLTADCPMAHMVAEGKIERMRKEYDDLAVVCYINSTAEIKCKSDVCVTSSNAVKIVRALPNKNIFFIPDRNLGRYVAEQVPEKTIIVNDGCCPIHAAITVEQLKKVKIDLNDLLQDARENGYFDISEIEYAVMEVSGKVSFLPKSKYQPVTCNDMKIKKEYSGLMANLVMDGKIMYEHLKVINRDEKWLREKIQKEGYKNIEDIFLVICDSKEKLTIYPMEVVFKRSVLE